MKPKYCYAAIVVLSLLLAGTRPALAISIPGDASIGTWDAATRTYTLKTNVDVYDTLEIDEDNLTLDGDGCTIFANPTINGINLEDKTGVTIKNVRVRNALVGIALDDSTRNTIINNIVSDNYTGIRLRGNSNENTLLGNILANSVEFGVILHHKAPSYNTVVRNNFLRNSTNVAVFSGIDNIIDPQVPTTGNYWSAHGSVTDGRFDTVNVDVSLGDPELCNGLDDDVDGYIDEDFTYNGLPIGDACTGIGVCSGAWGDVYCKDLYTADCTSNDPGSGDYGGSP